MHTPGPKDPQHTRVKSGAAKLRQLRCHLMELAGAAAKLPHKGAEYTENAKTRKAQGGQNGPKRPSAVVAL